MAKQNQKAVLMERDQESMNVPLEKVKGFEADGWKLTKQPESSEAAPIVAQNAPAPKGKAAVSAATQPVDLQGPTLRERRVEYIEILKAMSDEEVAALAKEKGIADVEKRNRRQLDNQLIELWNKENKE